MPSVGRDTRRSTQNLRILASLDDRAVVALGRARLGEGDAVLRLDVDVVPPVISVNAVVPQDGCFPLGTVRVDVARSGGGGGGQTEDDQLRTKTDTRITKDNLRFRWIADKW